MEHFSVDADFMTMAKGISSYYVPFAAVSVSSRINAPFEEGAPFVHGYTFGGHPLGCAAGCELIRVIQDEKPIENCNAQSERVFGYRDELLSYPTVADVRAWGLIMAIELVADKRTRRFFDRSGGAGAVPVHRPEARPADEQLALRQIPAGGPGGGLPIWVSPPSISAAEADDMMRRLLAMLTEWEDAVLELRSSARLPLRAGIVARFVQR